MSQTSKPWENNTPGDAGPYSAEQWAYMYRQLFTSVFTAHDSSGVFVISGDGTNSALLVAATSPATNQVKVYPGEALVNGRHYISDAQELLTISSNFSVNDRIDRIVLRQDFTAQTIRLAVSVGTAAASPTPPALTQDRSGIFEISLAQVTVPSGFVSISTVTDERMAVVNLLERGGHGINALSNPFVKGMLLVANSESEFVQTGALDDYLYLVGNTSNNGNASVISQRPHQLRGPNSSTWALTRPANSTSGTLIPFETAEYVNPDGYITSLASNLFTLEEGSYIVNAAIGVGNEQGQAHTVEAWIADDSAPTVQLVKSIRPQIPAFVSSGAPVIPAMIVDGLLESDGVQQFGVRFRSFSAGGAAFLSLDGSDEYQYIVSFRRIK